jgi:hypothetical protein
MIDFLFCFSVLFCVVVLLRWTFPLFDVCSVGCSCCIPPLFLVLLLLLSCSFSLLFSCCALRILSYETAICVISTYCKDIRDEDLSIYLNPSKGFLYTLYLYQSYETKLTTLIVGHCWFEENYTSILTWCLQLCFLLFLSCSHSSAHVPFCLLRFLFFRNLEDFLHGTTQLTVLLHRSPTSTPNQHRPRSVGITSLTNTPVTPPATAAMITKTALVNTLTTSKTPEEETVMVASEEIVVKDMAVLDTRSTANIMETARAEVKREEDNVIERVGGGELECGRDHYTRG